MRWISSAARRSAGMSLVLVLALESCCGSCVNNLMSGTAKDVAETLAEWSNFAASPPFWSTGAQNSPQPCTVSTGRQDVAVHVGPGEARATLRYLPADEAVTVSGRATADDGSAWWQVALEGVAQAWVSAAEVTAAGACDGVPDVAAPPIILVPITTDEPGDGPGAWGPCGSCPDCGADPSQCVRSPEGLCLWDPAGCGGIGPTPNPGCVPDGQSYCRTTYTIVCSPYQTRNCYDSCGALLSTTCLP